MITHTTTANTPTSAQDSDAASGNQVNPVRQSLSELHQEETGASTAEYGIVMLAAVAFAGLLTVVLTSDAVSTMLQGVIEQALGS